MSLGDFSYHDDDTRNKELIPGVAERDDSLKKRLNKVADICLMISGVTRRLFSYLIVW